MEMSYFSTSVKAKPPSTKCSTSEKVWFRKMFFTRSHTQSSRISRRTSGTRLLARYYYCGARPLIYNQDFVSLCMLQLAATVCKLMVTWFNSAINRGSPLPRPLGHHSPWFLFVLAVVLGKLLIYLTRFGNIYRSGCVSGAIQRSAKPRWQLLGSKSGQTRSECQASGRGSLKRFLDIVIFSQ